MAGDEKCVDSRHGKYELKIYWEDGITVECRYFITEEDAQDYVERNGIWDYVIVPNE
jgi:hypothetical protein